MTTTDLTALEAEQRAQKTGNACRNTFLATPLLDNTLAELVYVYQGNTMMCIQNRRLCFTWDLHVFGLFEGCRIYGARIYKDQGNRPSGGMCFTCRRKD